MTIKTSWTHLMLYLLGCLLFSKCKWISCCLLWTGCWLLHNINWYSRSALPWTGGITSPVKLRRVSNVWQVESSYQCFPTLGFYQASKNIVKHRVRVWLSGHAVEAEYPRHGEVSRLRPAQGRAVVRGSGGARTGDRSVVTHRPHSLYSLVGPNATMH